MRLQFPQPIKTAKHRDGVGWNAAEVDKWMLAGGWAISMEEHLDTIHETVKGAGDKVADVVKAYNEAILKFKGETKNDVAAISATADKVQKEVAKMSATYAATINQLNSADMERAIHNAERLASALQTINQVQDTSFAVRIVEDSRNSGAK